MGAPWPDSTYAYRIAFLIDGSAVTAGAKDVSIVLPKTLQPLWDIIDSNGYGVRFYDGDGFTALTYQQATWAYATRTGGFDVNAATQDEDNSMFVIYMMYGPDTVTDGAGSFTPSGALTARMFAGGLPAGVDVVDLRREAPGATAPAQEVQVNSAEKPFIFWRLPQLERNCAADNGHTDFEGPLWFTVTDESGAITLIQESDLRLVDCGDGRNYLLRSTFLTSGTSSGDVFWVEVTMGTSEGQERVGRVNVRYQDVA